MTARGTHRLDCLIIAIIFLWTIIRFIRLILIILSDNCPSSDIGDARFSQTQGSFRSVQLFGAGTHQVPWCAADLLQPVSCKNILRPSPTGPCHDSAARYRQWSFCCVAGNSLACPSIAPVLSLWPDRHWVQVLRLRSCVDDGNIRQS